MAREQEEKFRDEYGDDPAGKTYKEIQQIYAILADIDQRLGKLNRVLKDMNPERMESLERTQLLRRIVKTLTESEEEE